MFLQLIFIIFLLKFVWPLLQIFFAYTIGKRLFSHRSKLRKAGDWAIVTGGSAGIGKAYACELANEGLKVFLLGNKADELAETAQLIEQRYAVETKTMAVDFTRDDIYGEIQSAVDELSSIACLVNNVGMFYPESLSPWPESSLVGIDFIRCILWCNMVSTACMTRIVLRKILTQRPSGAAIINLSSISSQIPFPFFSLYGSTKAFILSLSEALRNELIDTSLIIQAVCPSLVATGMTRLSPSLVTPDAVTFAKSALDMLGVESVTCGYFYHALKLAIAKRLPTQKIKESAQVAFNKRVTADTDQPNEKSHQQ